MSTSSLLEAAIEYQTRMQELELEMKQGYMGLAGEKFLRRALVHPVQASYEDEGWLRKWSQGKKPSKDLELAYKHFLRVKGMVEEVNTSKLALEGAMREYKK